MPAPVLLTPEVVASGVGALGSIGSSFLNAAFNRSAMKDQLAASKELMDYQWQKFQSPLAQVNSLAAAGINPAVALGQGGSGFTATPSAAMPTSVPPQIGGISDLGSFVKALAEAKKANLEGVGKQLENTFNEQTLSDRVKAVGLQNRWTESNIVKVDQEISKIVADINVLQHDAEIRRIDAEKHSELIDKTIASYVAANNLSNQQANEIRTLLPEKLNQLQNQNIIQGVEADIQSDYGGTIKSLGVVGQVLNVISNLIKALKK